MNELRAFPIGDAAKAIMSSVPGARFTPGMVVGFDGPGGHGPEKAGAVVILHGTFADEEDTQLFYRTTNGLKKQVQNAAGFIRMFSLFDGVSGYSVSFWRSPEDAIAFSRGNAHREAARAFAERPFQYSQFAGVWAAHSKHARRAYCESCRTATEMPADSCKECGRALVDVFKLQEEALRE